MSGDDRSWVVVNAGADIAASLNAVAPLWPTAGRSSPVAAIALTDANVDHTAGVLEFRQASALDIYSTKLVKQTLCTTPMFSDFDRRFAWRTFKTASSAALVAEDLGDGLRLFAIPVHGMLPSYAGGAEMVDACVAFRFEQAHKRLVYAPIFLDVDALLSAELAQADAVFLDGTCWTDDEMQAQHLGTRSAREMGHVPMTETGGTLARVAETQARYKFFTHVNNSNPILDPTSAAATMLARTGFSVCDDGAEIAL